ncbi:MAG: SPOR domain-containing protein [candidate division Zixibacteria bacterium]|nr:SPOR domain-containing protein [candidate division Zixibacteria bacterium]
MRKPVNIYSLFLVLVGLLFPAGCGPTRNAEEEKTETRQPGFTDAREYDPLELPRDREIIPEAYPRSGAISGGSLIVESGSSKDDSVYRQVREVPLAVDTLNNQVYRVQLFTSQYYNEAKQAQAVAEEIFDQPVFVDYEVPYFKVRVGNFASRFDAEAYQQKTREVGYTSAWVVVVNLNIRESAPLYENLPGLLIESDSTLKAEDTVSTGDEQDTDE